MKVFTAFLRAVNVGGYGKLAMADLARVCREAGFRDVQTYIASGNVVFRTGLDDDKARATLERHLLSLTDVHIPVFVRDLPELSRILADCPFPDAPGNRVTVTFLQDAPSPDTIEESAGRSDETIALGRREIYIHYAGGIGTSRLRVPAAAQGTARNMNTVSKLVEIASNLAV